MKLSSGKGLMIGAALTLLAAGCGEDSPPPAPLPSPQKVTAPAPAQTPAPSAESAAEAPPAFAYDPAGRRDPFEPLVLVRKPLLKSELPTTPLQTYEVGQLRLVGVIVGKGSPRAMVVAPDGKAYILQKGVSVGRNSGKVKDIRSEVVLVEEKYVDFSGEVRTGVQEIRLPKREGVL